MYKVLIVDDEEVVREGIRSKIKWDELGFVCVATAADGREAMDLADELAPHLVVTDIYMPFVDGLELAEYLYVTNPDVKTIILSGFDEFDFAVRALKYKVRDYILKPVTSAELTELLRKIKRELDAENEKRLEISNIKTLLEENGPVIKERFLNRLVKGEARTGGLFKTLDFIGLPCDKGYIIAVIDPDGAPTDSALMEYGEELLFFSVFNISDELVSELSENGEAAGVVFQNSDSRTIIIFWGQDAQTNCADICKRILDIIPKTLNFTVTIGVSRVFADISEIAARYSEAQGALERRFIMGNNRLINAGEYEHSQRSFFDSLEHEEQIISSVKSGETESVLRRVDSLFANLRASGVSVETCRAVVQRLLLKIQLLIMRLDIEISEVFGQDSDIMADLYRFKTLGEINERLKSLCACVNEYLRARREGYSKNIAMKAVEYVKENYQSPEISVSSVSRTLSVSTSYFSSLFKQTTGETFIEFLTKTRLHAAKELLSSTNLKTYEISDRVGYTDPHYFSILFKKHTGYTPTSYREQSGGEKD